MDLKADPALAVDYVVAPPRMAKYIEISTQIYNVYLKYIAPEDIHVYSIDEVMIDATSYLGTYHMTARELAHNGDHRDHGDRHKPLSLQGRYGHHGQTRRAG